MRFRYLAGASLAVALATPVRGWAQTVQTFDDIPCNQVEGDPNTPVFLYGPVNYGGNFICYGWAQPPFNPHSGTNRVYGLDFSDPFFFTGGPVTFDGAWFSGTGANVTFQLFLGAAPVWTSSSLSTSGIPTFLSSGYGGMVDQVQVVTNSRRQYIMDDVTFSSSAVPEPASIMLVGTGLVGLYGAARRRRNRAA